MFYKLCILKVNGFCTKDLLCEHEFPQGPAVDITGNSS